MGNKPQALRELRYKLLVHQAGDGYAHEGTKCDHHIVKCARLALLNKLLARSSFGLDNFRQGSDLSPFLVRAGKRGSPLSAGSSKISCEGLRDLLLDFSQEKDFGLGHGGKWANTPGN
jgi:hypothetical protein